MKTIYTPESPLSHPGRLVSEMLRDLLASRELAWRLFVRDTKGQYRQTALGYFWAFLPPLATSATFVFLTSQKIVTVTETPIPYPAFVLIGTTLWQTFVDAINSPLKVVQSSRAMLAKINFPREALILAGLGEVSLNFAIRSLILIFAIFWFQLAIPATIWLVPFGIISLIAFGLMLGILLTPLGILYQDIGRGMSVITAFWMLLTPVVYPSPTSGPAALLARWNPVSPIITTTREWLTEGSATHLDAFLLVAALTVVCLFLGWVLYRLAMPHLVERMGG